jgi:hypothetical protein
MAVDDVSHDSPATAAQCRAGRGYNPLKVTVSRHALHYAAADRLQTEERRTHHNTVLFFTISVDKSGGWWMMTPMKV